MSDRERFQTTLAAVRENFNDLFRKLFNGGRADIVLEEGLDELDAGIEITAKPPGKESTNLMLLSGGETTMTTLALIMAIFKTRPSPFCILDEADAALDEANVKRFVGLLNEFTETTQFIVITHNQRTMAMADVLYGVTMETPGISKRVQVDLRNAPKFAGVNRTLVPGPKCRDSPASKPMVPL